MSALDEAKAALARAQHDAQEWETVIKPQVQKRTDDLMNAVARVIGRSEEVMAQGFSPLSYALGYLHCMQDIKVERYPVVEQFAPREPEPMR